jgi:hypothetical protein
MDVVVRVVLSGLIIGVPSYWLGMEVLGGRTFTKAWLRISGAVIYGLFALILSSIWIPLAGAIGLAAVLAVIGASIVPLMPEWQAKLRSMVRR